MDIFIIATKTCTHCANLVHALTDLGYPCEVKYVEEHPELVIQHQIRHSPNLLVDGKVIFRNLPTEDELREKLESMR